MPIERIKKLKNGLRIAYLPQAGFSSTIFMLFVPGGSRYDGNMPGLAHLTEHIVGAWLENFAEKKYGKIMASNPLLTNFDATVNRRYARFSFDTHKDDAEKAAETLAGLLNDFTISPEHFELEKNSASRELREEIDSSSQILNLDVEKHFGKIISPAKPIIGSAKTIKKIKVLDVLNFFDRYYKNSNALLVIAGNIPDHLKRKTEDSFSRPKLSPAGKFGFGKPAAFASKIRIFNDRSASVYFTAYLPLPNLHRNNAKIWKFIAFSVEDYFRQALRTKKSFSYSAETHLEDTWNLPIMEFRFSANAGKSAEVLRAWKESLRDFAQGLDSKKCGELLKIYTKELEADEDYPIARAKKIGHEFMLFGKSPSKDKTLPAKRVLAAVKQLAELPALIHAVGPSKKMNGKKLLAALS